MIYSGLSAGEKSHCPEHLAGGKGSDSGSERGRPFANVTRQSHRVVPSVPGPSAETGTAM